MNRSSVACDIACLLYGAEEMNLPGKFSPAHAASLQYIYMRIE
jgi:hypothetical protein